MIDKRAIKATNEINRRLMMMKLVKEMTETDWENLQKSMKDLEKNHNLIGEVDMMPNQFFSEVGNVIKSASSLQTAINTVISYKSIERDKYTRRVIKFGDRNQFKFWSPKVKGESDKSVAKKDPSSRWKKIIVLMPTGDPKTIFSIGFCSVFEDTVVMDAVRRVEQGAFGMRLGPEDCDFFIASGEGKVELAFVKYTVVEDPRVFVY